MSKTYIHNKTGNEYIVLARNARLEKEGMNGKLQTVYQGENGTWVRTNDEFNDGRFREAGKDEASCFFTTPPRQEWPEVKYNDMETSDDLKTAQDEVYFVEHAMALLMVEEIVAILHDGNGGTSLQVIVNDTFGYACADCESIPPTGFGNDSDFWDLYNTYRVDGYHGVVRWVAMRREQQPNPTYVERMKADGTWTPELEAFKDWQGK